MEKKNYLYEAFVSVEIKNYPPNIPLKKIYIVSSTLKEAISKLTSFLENSKDIEKYEILEIKKLSEGYDYLIP